MDVEKWRNEIQSSRRRKDDFFRGFQSPLTDDAKEHFKGLSYFPPDAAYRFELELREHTVKKIVTIKDTKGMARDFLRFGEFAFTVNGASCVLQAFVSDIEDKRLFVPFRDATTGTETYPAGRYIDLSHDINRLSNGKWVLDFNTAYNPWCAYSEAYACPLTPAENLLPTPIRAGEKNFSPAHAA